MLFSQLHCFNGITPGSHSAKISTSAPVICGFKFRLPFLLFQIHGVYKRCTDFSEYGFSLIKGKILKLWRLIAIWQKYGSFVSWLFFRLATFMFFHSDVPNYCIQIDYRQFNQASYILRIASIMQPPLAWSTPPAREMWGGRWLGCMDPFLTAHPTPPQG